MMSLFATAESTQKEAPSLDFGSILSSMPSLPVQKTLNRSNTSDLLDFSKELSVHEKFLAEVRELKQKELAEKEAKKRKPKVKEGKKEKREKKEKGEKEKEEGDWFLKTSKTKLLNKTKYVHPSHLPQGLEKDNEVSDGVSEISYVDDIFDDIQIKKKSMQEESDKADYCPLKEKIQPEKAKIMNTLTVNQGTSSKSTTPSRSPSPMPRDLSKELNIKNNKIVSEKTNPNPIQKNDKKDNSYLQKLYKHREATEKVQTSDRKLDKKVTVAKEEAKTSKVSKPSGSSNLTPSKTTMTVVSSSSGKRPLMDTCSKDEPNRVKKAIVENKNGPSLKSRQVEHDRVKHSKQKRVAYVSEDEDDENDSFIDDEEFEQRDCEEMELYRKFMASYRRKTAMRRHLERDIRDMEATFEELQKEDKKTALIGKMEDEVELVAINKEREREMKYQRKSRKI